MNDYVLMSISSIEFDGQGNSVDLNITSHKNKLVNGKYTEMNIPVGCGISSKPDWVNVNGSTISADKNSGSNRSGQVVISQEESGKTLSIPVSQEKGIEITYDDIAYMENNLEGIEENERDGFYTQRYPQGADVTLHFWIRRWRLENGERKDYEDLVAEPRIDYNDTDSYTARISPQNQGDVICRKVSYSDYTASIGFTLTYEGSKQISFYIDFD